MDTDDALIEFLRARLDEDEQLARAANCGPWQARKITGPTIGTDEAEVVHVSDVPDRGFYRLGMDRLDGPDARHIAANDPEYVLADIEAKRRILDVYEQEAAISWAAPSILRWLALPYADHPDYRPEWRP